MAPTKNISLGYDGLDRLITASGIWGSGNFSYDAIGNLKSKTLGSQSLTYNYNGRNQLSSIGGSLSRSFNYDSRGHVTNNSQRSFSFNLANQLVSSGTTSYQYDGYNRRVKKQSNGKTQYSLYNAAGQLMMTAGEQGPTEYFYLGNKLVAKESQVLTTEDTPGYTGHLEDDELGLTYMQQRYYDPVIGRFYSNDPVGFTASNPMMFNRYAYANNNPYKFTDPDGAYPSPTGLQNMHKWQEEARVKAGMSHREHAKAQLGLYGTAAMIATPFAAAATGLRASATIIMSEASTALGVAEASLSNTPGLDFAKEMISKIGGDHLTKISSGISREFGDNIG